jgi:hypothetical protein
VDFAGVAIRQGADMFKTIMFAAALTLPVAANAVTVIYDTPASTPGNQNWAGTLGLDFTVNAPVKVTSLGTFDSGKDGITSDIFVAIFDSAGSIISPVVSFNGTANPGGTAYVFQSITPFTLAAGNYQLGAWGYNNTDMNYNAGFVGLPGAITFNSFGGKLTATGTRYANAAGGIGTIVDVGATRYGAGSMTVANVPEPASWAMLLSGFALVGYAARRRQRIVAA